MIDKIVLASDHGGYILKKEIIKFLNEKNIQTVDLGCNDTTSCDYPIYAKKLANEIQQKNYQKGILICGTGLGMQITANKFKGIRAVCVSDTFSAKMSVEHNDANILCLGGRVLGVGLAKEIVDTWINSTFQKERHAKRVSMIEE